MTRRTITIVILAILSFFMSGAAATVRGATHGPGKLMSELVPGAHPSTQDLIRALGDVNPEVRWRAAVALVKMGPPAMPSVIGALASANAYVRQGAAEVLGNIGRRTDEVTAKLIKALGDPEARVREHAAEALGKLKARDAAAIQALTAALGDGDLYVVGQTAAALAKTGPDAVAPLALALQDKKEPVREAATIAIGKLGIDGLPAVPALIKALGDAPPMSDGVPPST